MVYVVPTLGVEEPDLVKMAGSQRGGGRGGQRTVRVYFVACGSVSPSMSKYGPIILGDRSL
jgi:hypothetical protein